MLTKKKLLTLKDRTRTRKISLILTEAAHQASLGKEVDLVYINDILPLENLAPIDSALGGDLKKLSFKLEDYAQACRYLESAKGEGSAEACLFLGRAYEATGDYNYAVSVYNNYVVKDTGNASVYNQIGLCRLKQGEYQEALTAFQTAMNIEENGMMQTLAFNEIIAYEYLGEFKQASVLMENYIRTYPDDLEAQREYEFLKTR